MRNSVSVNKVSVLGSTGSIGVNTLDVIATHPDRFQIYGLSAFKNVELMFAQCEQYLPEVAVMADPRSAEQLHDRIQQAGLQVEVRSGEQEVCVLAAGPVETVVCGIVGAAGLMSTIAAVKAGKKVLVANKEPLVMLGDHIIELAQQHGACLLPVDSEHNAIFQCLPQQPIVDRNGHAVITREQGIRKILLTGSGGPFRQLAPDMFAKVTPDQACAHPNWVMGRKISVDSATMMNKGLELIEACVIFGVEAENVEIVVHPQSIIHSMVEYIDGSILAQMGSPDMRVPIANALGWPDRIESGAAQLDFRQIARFDFETPDYNRFPALVLAEEAAKQRGTMPAVLNAANEIAVDAFLNHRISFDRIPVLVEKTMLASSYSVSTDLDTVLEADAQSRLICQDLIEGEV